MQVVLPLLEEREAVEEEALCPSLLALVPHRDLPFLAPLRLHCDCARAPGRRRGAAA